mgnify:CR=1 FL=1
MIHMQITSNMNMKHMEKKLAAWQRFWLGMPEDRHLVTEAFEKARKEAQESPPYKGKSRRMLWRRRLRKSRLHMINVSAVE